MNRKFMTFVMTVALSLFVALPAAAQVPGGFNIPLPDMPEPASSADEVADDGADAGAPAPDAVPIDRHRPRYDRDDCPFGLTEDIEYPGRRRCRTWDEVREAQEWMLKHEMKRELEKEVSAAFQVAFMAASLVFIALSMFIFVLLKSRITRTERNVQTLFSQSTRLITENIALRGRMARLEWYRDLAGFTPRRTPPPLPTDEEEEFEVDEDEDPEDDEPKSD